VTILDDPNREAVGLAPIWTGAGEEPPPPEGDDELPGNPEAYTIPDIRSWVDAHPHYAADVLAHEQARGAQARSSLVEWLEGFVESHDGDEG
jgi:hypothetical protein